MLRLVGRLLRRELRSGELRLLLAALVLAVAAVTAVGFLSERIRQALQLHGNRMLGADLVLVGDAPWPQSWQEMAAAAGLQVARTQVFPSMVQVSGRSQLAEVKAVSAAYPLVGRLLVGGQPAAAPVPGTVWVDGRLAGALAVTVGDRLQLGRAQLQIAGLLTQEPDRGFGFFSLAPRLMVAEEDLPATGLTGWGARIRHRLLLAGPADAVRRFAEWAKPQLIHGQRLEDLENARPEIRNVLDRAERFLGLATVLTVILAAVAVALAARRYTQRHLDTCAVLRCLGVTQAGLLLGYAGLFSGLALLAALIGGLGGYGLHAILADWVGQALAMTWPPLAVGSWPALAVGLRGLAVAWLVVLAFAGPPLWHLTCVPPLRVLRRELGAGRSRGWWAGLAGYVTLAGLVYLLAGNVQLGSIAVLGFTGALLAFGLLARLVLAAAARLRRRLGHGVGSGWRRGLANLGRQGHVGALQMVALALGFMAWLLLSVTGQQLLTAWQATTPVDAPNRFLLNIQPAQRQAVRGYLAERGIEIELAPMVRARLLQIGARPLSAASYPEDERARRLIEREFNLSMRAELPPGNLQLAGRWFTAADAGQPLASLEVGLAKTLGITVGDQLRFMVDGRELVLRVVGLRQLSWDSLHVNFFVLTPPGVLDQAPATDISSFYLPPAAVATVDGLVAQFPNLTVIDVGAVVQELTTVVTQIIAAVRLLLVLTLLAGVVVLYAAVLAAFDERRYELALLRALGAERRQLRQALWVEFAALGALAGLLAALAAQGLGWLIAERVLQLTPTWDAGVLVLAMFGGAAFTTLIALLALRPLLRTSPLLILHGGAD